MAWTGDSVKLFMCRKSCGHGTFLFSPGQIPLLSSLQATAERLGPSLGRVSDTEEGATGNAVTKLTVLISLTSVLWASCLVQTNKCRTDLPKAIVVVKWSGLKFSSIPGLHCCKMKISWPKTSLAIRTGSSWCSSSTLVPYWLKMRVSPSPFAAFFFWLADSIKENKRLYQVKE